jgi:hypothetical protein
MFAVLRPAWRELLRMLLCALLPVLVRGFARPLRRAS